MANPSSPSRASRNAPQRKVHRYIDALVSDDFGRQSTLTVQSANSFARKKLDAAAHSLQLKGERREKQLRRIEIREWRAAERSVAAELRESDQRIRLMWRSLRTKVRPEKKVRHTPPKERKRHWPYTAVALPKYDSPVIDRNGQRGVFMRMRYYSRRTAEAGVSQRVAKYCFNGAELDPDGNPYVATNIGATIDEALCGFDHLEQVNWSAAKNAKLLMHGIMAVDHRQSPDEMMTVGLRWAEEALGRFDLPYLVTLHAPPPDGDQRNWHLHILWSCRPLVRTGDHEWQVGEILRTDLDNPKAMKLFREMFANVMTEMSFEAGQNQVWTAKSNADRGLPHEPQVHLGGADTNRARSGEHVAGNEENHERVMRSKAKVIDDALRQVDAALAKVQDAARAIAARFVRISVLSMRVPERAAAAAMSLEAPVFEKVPPLSNMQIILSEAPPLIGIEPARITGSIEPTGRRPQRSTVGIIITAPQERIAQPARLEIANLRIHVPRMSTKSVGPSAVMPVVPAEPPAFLALKAFAPPRLAKVEHRTVLAPVVPVANIARLHAFTPLRRAPIFADISVVDRAVERSADARKRDAERRKREDEAIARIAREARAVADQAAIQRQTLEDNATPATPRKNAWLSARDRRERAMAAWDAVARIDQSGMEQLGREIPRPGADRRADPSSPRIRLRGLPDRGISE